MSFKMPGKLLMNNTYKNYEKASCVGESMWSYQMLTFKPIIQTVFCCIYCVSVYIWTCFNNSGHLFPIFLTQSKEMRKDSRALHSIVKYTYIFWEMCMCILGCLKVRVDAVYSLPSAFKRWRIRRMVT